MQKRVIFNDKALPYLLLAPQLLISVIFFFWPAAQAVQQSLLREDAFGLRSEFVGLENFTEVLTDPFYLNAVSNTVVFSTAVAASAMGVALLLAALADQQFKGARAYRTLLVWPYAIAPAISAVLWLFLFHPSIGIISRMLQGVGVAWDYRLNGAQAMTLVIIASAWKQVSYNFIFFLAALQSIPKSVLDAAAIDGASAWHRFRTIVLPLISPTTFFLLVVNLTYAFFDTFGVIHALTGGGPGKATETLIYKAYADGVQNLNLGSSAAQSVILMVAVIALTMIQFRFIERKVHY